uniref:F-box/LRR-repeat protein 15-like leucin rich repeat domain-containing protein n=1 Tax=Latimeria chalumnae TaxID=7897 RepID=H3AM70_LATCH
SLKSLCLNNVVDNMKTLWAKDYSENYLDQYQFLYIQGPFNDLTGGLVQELLRRLGETHRLNRAYLHLLLVPHLTQLSLRSCCGLVSNAICQLIAARCKNLLALDLCGCSRVQSSVLVDLIEGLPSLRKLDLSGTQCTTQVLSAVGSTCRELRELSISECKQVTSAGLVHLAYDQTRGTFNCSQLRTLVATGVEPKGDSTGFVKAVVFLLLALPSLEYFAVGYLIHALHLIQGQQFAQCGDFTDGNPFPSLAKLAQSRRTLEHGDCQIALKLKRLNDVGEHLLPLLISLCKQVVEVTILCNDEPNFGWNLSSWKNLTHLTVQCTGTNGRPLSEMAIALEELGPNLQHLSLHNFRHEDETSLSTILRRCPNLRVFSTYLSSPQEEDGYEVVQDEEDEDDLLLVYLGHTFKHLRQFNLVLMDTFKTLPRQNEVFLKSTLVSLLRASPKLEKLSLICIPFPLDKVFQKVLEAPMPVFGNLRELSLENSNVSRATIHSLMNEDNQLALMHLVQCQNIYRRDYDQFLQVIKQKKFELQINWP